MKKIKFRADITAVTVVIFIVCIVLVSVMLMQFRTVEQTDITEIENMRESELRTALAEWKMKYEEVSTQLDDVNARIEEYNTTINNNEETSKLIDEELKESNILVGKTDVYGEGVVVTLANSNEQAIEAYDLIDLVNELRYAGAEAISINDQRIVSNTVIECIGAVIKINGQRVGAPFTIKAIGMPELLKNTYRNGGYLKVLEGDRIQVDFKTSDNITIPKYTGTYKFEYAQTINNK